MRLQSLWIALLCGAILAWQPLGFAQERPADIVALKDIAPKIAQDIRYASAFNFLGRPVAGYEAPMCLLTRPAAKALAAVQADLRPLGLGLKVYDCYRPERAVQDFVSWGHDGADDRMKAAFYPAIAKQDVFKLGYVAAHSSHSRASTVDLTLIPLKLSAQQPYTPGERLPDCRQPRKWQRWDNSLDMGTAFDCFDNRAHTDASHLPPSVRQARDLLRQVMAAHGFTNLPEEWWHYTLRDEPYPNQSFDFPVR